MRYCIMGETKNESQAHNPVMGRVYARVAEQAVGTAMAALCPGSRRAVIGTEFRHTPSPMSSD